MFKRHLSIFIKKRCFMMSKQTLIMIIFILLIFIITLVFYLLFLRRELQFHKLQQKELDDYAIEIEAIYSEMRGIRHDYRNHMQVMAAYLQKEELLHLENYMDELTNELNQVDTIIRTGNTLIDALVNTKLTRAQTKRVSIDATAIAPAELSIQDVDLAIVLGNLLNNAIEATTIQKNKKLTGERFIRLYIAPIKNNLYISVTNTMDQNPQKNYLSLKAPNRQGYGLRRIDQTIQKYNGLVNRQWEDGVFATEITIPLAKTK